MVSTNETAEAMFRVIADLHAAYGDGVTIVGMDRNDDPDRWHVTLIADSTVPPSQALLGITVWHDGEVWASPVNWDGAPEGNAAMVPPSETDYGARVAGALDAVRVFLHRFGNGAR